MGCGKDSKKQAVGIYIGEKHASCCIFNYMLQTFAVNRTHTTCSSIQASEQATNTQVYLHNYVMIGYMLDNFITINHEVAAAALEVAS